MKNLLKLNNHSRKVCFSIETEKCCGELITDLNRFKVQITKDSNECQKVLITYPFFDTNDDGSMCILLDDSMKDLCPGRYLFHIMLDDCVKIDKFKFSWGVKPVVTKVSLESNSQDLCFNENEPTQPESLIPETCCESCKDPDKPCEADCDPCADKGYEDPRDLIGGCNV